MPSLHQIAHPLGGALHGVARALGGVIVGHASLLVPGPGHSLTDRSLSVKFDPVAPDGFVVFSFAGDSVIACRDHVRAALGLRPSDCVAKVFLGERPKFFRTADGFRTWRYGGPHRFTQKRPRSLVWALRSIAVVQPAKSQLLRDFRRRSIFDFCNTIGTFQTCLSSLTMSVHGGRADSLRTAHHFRV